MRPALTILAVLLVSGFVLGVDERAPEETDATEAADAATEGELVARADDAAVEDGPKTLSGMSVLGNQEAPKSLVIVPWKSSEIGDSLGISAMLDEGRQPVDRDVFLRALAYHEIRSEGNSTRTGSEEE